MRPSSVRLKVRNIDEKQVTNDDLRVSILNYLNSQFNDFSHIHNLRISGHYKYSFTNTFDNLLCNL
jgi:hypothetical protein